jgi:hypothetical protein
MQVVQGVGSVVGQLGSQIIGFLQARVEGLREEKIQASTGLAGE